MASPSQGSARVTNKTDNAFLCPFTSEYAGVERGVTNLGEGNPSLTRKQNGSWPTPFGALRKRKPRLRPNISLSLTSVTVLRTHDLLPRGCVVIVSLWLIAKPFLWRKAAHTQLPLQRGQRSVCVMSVVRKEIPRTWCLGLEAPATCGHLPPTASSLWKLLHIDLPVSPVSWLCPIHLSQEWHR